MAPLPPGDLNALADARAVLDYPSLAIRLADRVGRPIEGLVRRLPDDAQRAIARGTRRALEVSLGTALDTLDRRARVPPGDWLHLGMVVASGAAGGAMGVAGLALELPFSLTVMLRSIADHARAQGEDLDDVATRLECLAVFAYGSRSARDDAADAAYFAVRAALTRTIGEAAAFLAERGAGGALARKAPALVAFVARVAERLGIAVTDKAAAQLVPVLGAAGGAAVNAIFMQHYQDTARAHFTVRRLERAHGLEAVRRAWDEVG